MQKIKSVKFNFLMNLILTGSGFLFPLLTFPYVSRILEPDGIGKVAFATSFITYFVIYFVIFTKYICVYVYIYIFTVF